MRHYSRGFTLIELLVVVAIIGILSAVGVVSYSGYKAAAETKQAEITLNSIYLAEQEHKSNNGNYYISSNTQDIINNLFDGVDDLSEQKYSFSIKSISDCFCITDTRGGSDNLYLNQKKKKTNC